MRDDKWENDDEKEIGWTLLYLFRKLLCYSF